MGNFQVRSGDFFFVPITHTNIDITLIVSNVQPCVSNFLCCCNTRYCFYLIKKHVYSKSHTVFKASIGKKKLSMSQNVYSTVLMQNAKMLRCLQNKYLCSVFKSESPFQSVWSLFSSFEQNLFTRKVSLTCPILKAFAIWKPNYVVDGSRKLKFSFMRQE